MRFNSAAPGSFPARKPPPIILDEDGDLLLATPTPEGLTVASKVALLSNNSWTVPSLAGTRLYLRDRKNIMALDLGKQ